MTPGACLGCGLPIPPEAVAVRRGRRWLVSCQDCGLVQLAPFDAGRR